ncbi:MAG TPA: helix-turn-helix transcriptional regulator, partial [Acidimicrobiales bacterium]|nr:helix-turn-helix transcriptional regulator [Acidimicrobiales bacterium]
IDGDDPGQQVVLDRLLDLLLVSALRAAFTSTTEMPKWYAASADPIVGSALRLMHERAGEPWTVTSLASTVGVSRAHLSRRFHDLVGEPPMTFLTAWRMALAADRLLEPDTTVTAVSALVGYTSPFTFSTAFKRHYGTSPRSYRRAHSA